MEEKQRILLCEDDENLGMLLREYLQAKGYYAELCPDGDAGYKAFLKGKFDICVFDVMMPIKDGFTLAQEIRQVNTEAISLFTDIISGIDGFDLFSYLLIMLSTYSKIPRKEILSLKNASTATSFAAFKTVGIMPPISPAFFARAKRLKVSVSVMLMLTRLLK